jgi:two-component system response regulator AtoC
MHKQTQDEGDVNITAKSAAMQRVLEMVERVALAVHTSVLIHGESGTGKGLIARRIHNRTPGRSVAPFAAINCASLPESSLDGELFGYEKGTGPDAKTTHRRGLLDVADGGTLLLDEIAEMHPGIQGKLMKMLEERTFRRLGGTKEIKLNARIVAATNRDLAFEVQHGRFRLDLYHRLNVFDLRIPPLRERREDIVPLAKEFLTLVSRDMNRGALGLHSRAEKLLRAHDYSGNVRELKNLIERAVILSTGDVIGPNEIVLPPPPQQEPSSLDFFAVRLDEAGQPPTLDGLEAQYIARLLTFAQGNRTKVARLLGVSYPTVIKKIADYRLNLDGSR